MIDKELNSLGKTKLTVFHNHFQIYLYSLFLMNKSFKLNQFHLEKYLLQNIYYKKTLIL